MRSTCSSASSRIRWSSAWRSTLSPSSRCGQRRGFGRIVAQQQAESIVGVGHPAGGIEPRAEHETQVPGHDLLAGKPGGFDQGPDPDPAAVGQQLEAVPHQYPVFSLQRHDVGHGGQRHEIEQMERKIGRQPKRGHQGLDQLERDAGSAEIVGARACRRTAVGLPPPVRRVAPDAGQVVIGDDDTDAGLARGAAPCRCGDAAVAGDDERGVDGPGGLETGGPKS